jgi:hypothetical protein
MAQTTHRASFGPVLVIAALPKPPVAYFISNSLYIVISINKTRWKERNLLMAQTTRRASFEPVLVVTTFREPKPLHRFKRISPIVVSVLIKLGKKRKDLLMAQTTCDTSFGPVLVVATFLKPPRRFKGPLTRGMAILEWVGEPPGARARATAGVGPKRQSSFGPFDGCWCVVIK